MSVATAAAFDVHGRNLGTLHPDGTSTRRTFDGWGNTKAAELRDRAAAVVQSATMTPTPSGRIKSMSESVGAGLTRDHSFVWDGGGRVSGAAVSGRTSRMAFDESGHIMSSATGFVSQTFGSHDGGLAQHIESTERFGQASKADLAYDTLGNAAHVNVGRLAF